MHKDPPPSFFERPLNRLIIEGMLVGLAASIIVMGGWALVSSRDGEIRRENVQLPDTQP